MLEYCECIAANRTVEHWFSDVFGTTDLSLKGIWADATKAKRKSTKDSQAKHCLVYLIPHTTRIKQCTNNTQKPVYPPSTWSKQSNLNPLASFVLHGIHASPRNVILDLTALWLQIQLHTHTLAQIYTRSQWDNSIAKVDSTICGFKVGMALDFGEYILVFDTLDNIFTWISQRQCSKTAVRSNLAVNIIRTDGHLCFGGIGIYTVNEIFYLAGLSVFLTKAEVFDSADCVARFCEAFWTFAHHTNLLKPCWHGYVLAVTEDQCLQYSHWLHVYGKDATMMSDRMASLCQVYIGTLAQHENDVWSYASGIVPSEKDLTLCHLIFGEDRWFCLTGKQPAFNDPITHIFVNSLYLTVGIPIPRFNDNAIDSLFLDVGDLCKRHIVPDLYLGDRQKHLWTITPNFPSHFVSGTTDRGSVQDGKIPFFHFVDMTLQFLSPIAHESWLILAVLHKWKTPILVEVDGVRNVHAQTILKMKRSLLVFSLGHRL
ncbi:hypothetical protein BV22DRAFT_1050885 [Leucogyrophana mollusca]|uniref:Uncharacterized protein n=1 Tax=Leucogyrophana mollusca TaxID=85980 RepID=A0ACB8B380_9AGAM|nr:hypothetical protein BV22DRAFT_1050885 [Leucogyrophana mollusca]